MTTAHALTRSTDRCPLQAVFGIGGVLSRGANLWISALAYIFLYVAFGVLFVLGPSPWAQSFAIGAGATLFFFVPAAIGGPGTVRTRVIVGVLMLLLIWAFGVLARNIPAAVGTTVALALGVPIAWWWRSHLKGEPDDSPQGVPQGS